MKNLEKGYRVVPYYNYWALMKEGENTPLDIFMNQYEALKRGERNARHDLTKVTVYDQNGAWAGSISFYKRTFYSEENNQMRDEVFEVKYSGVCTNSDRNYYLVSSDDINDIEFLQSDLEDLNNDLETLLSNIKP